MLKFQIKDFQSLENASIVVEGLTLLIGESSQGKSSCLKALRAACYNRFHNGQVRYGTDHSTIRVLFDEHKLSVRRSINGGSPIMVLDGMRYEKLGKDVPLAIEQALNMAPLQVLNDKYSLNFFSQFENPVLMDISQKKLLDLLASSKVLDKHQRLSDKIHDEALGAKAQLKSLDNLLSEAKSKVSQVRFEIKELEPYVLKLKELSLQLNQVNEQLGFVDSLKQLLTSVINCDSISALIEKINEHFTIDKQIHSIEEVLNSSNEELSIVTTLISKVAAYNSLKIQLSDINVLEVLNSQCRTQASQMSNLNKILIDRVCPVCGSVVS